MAKAKILTGARALIRVKGVAVGLFSQCNWSIGQDKQPAYILGRFNPAEITPTGQDAVSMRLSGYRVVGLGPYDLAQSGGQGMATKLVNLLNEEDFTVEVLDRVAGTDGKPRVIFKAFGCRVRGWSSGVAARGVSDISLDVVGLKGGDESQNSDADDRGAPNLDDN
jgi:hypothetical protein